MASRWRFRIIVNYSVCIKRKIPQPLKNMFILFIIRCMNGRYIKLRDVDIIHKWLNINISELL